MTAANRQSPFLPEGMSSFFRRRMIELSALIIGLVALALALAFASYSTADPSFNNVADISPRNWLGLPGARVADIALQTLGVSSWLATVIFASWAWRIGSHKGLKSAWLRIILLPTTLVLGCITLTSTSLVMNWSSAHDSGGFLGQLLLARILGVASHIGLPTAPHILAIFSGTLTLLSLFFALGLSAKEWGFIIRSLFLVVSRIGKVIFWFSHMGKRLAFNPPPDQEHQLDTKPPKNDKQLSFGSLKAIISAQFTRTSSAREVEVLSPQRLEPTLDGNLSQSTPLSAATDQNIVAEVVPSRVSQPSPKLPSSHRADREAQVTLNLGMQEISLPPLNLLTESRNRVNRISENALEQNARLLEGVLNDFGVNGEIVRVRPGPVVTLYELEPARGTKAARVIGLADDIARSMSAVSARVAVIPGQNAIGIELPNSMRETVYLRELLSSEDYESSAGTLTLALGKDISGEPVFADLARMPHLLVAGTTGSGKSVAVNSMILSLLYKLRPDECKLIMIDPKMLELSVYDNIPHLLAPVVTEPGKAVVALKWVVREMEQRYRAMSHLGVRNIAGYNQRLTEALKKKESLTRTVQTGYDAETGEPIFEEQALDLTLMPYIVVVVDEMADLMLIAGKDIEASVQRLAQMARAAGIHLIMATQRPSVDVITGTIKANFPTRISFQVTSKIDSRTILGEPGAETLLGSGDMLYMQAGGKIRRVHGPFVSDGEVEKIVRFMREQANPVYVDEVTEEPEGTSTMPGATSAGGENATKDDQLYDQAVALICREGKASTSFVQRHLQIGYNRAARIVERMEAEGVVSKPNHVGKREILARTLSAEEQ